MCTIPLAILAVSAGGAGLQAYGSYQSAEGQKRAFKYNANVNELQAKDAERRGVETEQRQREQISRLKGTQRAQLAANGLDLTEGSALNILTDTDFLGERDIGVIRDNASREAAGFRSRGDLNRFGANATRPLLTGTTSLLSGAGSVAAQWYGFKTSGATK